MKSTPWMYSYFVRQPSRYTYFQMAKMYFSVFPLTVITRTSTLNQKFDYCYNNNPTFLISGSLFIRGTIYVSSLFSVSLDAIPAVSLFSKSQNVLTTSGSNNFQWSVFLVKSFSLFTNWLAIRLFRMLDFALIVVIVHRSSEAVLFCIEGAWGHKSRILVMLPFFFQLHYLPSFTITLSELLYFILFSNDALAKTITIAASRQTWKERGTWDMVEIRQRGCQRNDEQTIGGYDALFYFFAIIICIFFTCNWLS